MGRATQTRALTSRGPDVTCKPGPRVPEYQQPDAQGNTLSNWWTNTHFCFFNPNWETEWHNNIMKQQLQVCKHWICLSKLLYRGKTLQCRLGDALQENTILRLLKSLISPKKKMHMFIFFFWLAECSPYVLESPLPDVKVTHFHIFYLWWFIYNMVSNCLQSLPL